MAFLQTIIGALLMSWALDPLAPMETRLLFFAWGVSLWNRGAFRITFRQFLAALIYGRIR